MNMANKGITIIIAIIIATALTLAVAASAFYFFQRFQVQTQGATESAQANFLTRIATCSKLAGVVANSGNNLTNIILKNCGFRKLNVGDNNTLVVIETEKGATCSFVLNDDNCANCNVNVDIGAFVNLEVNMSKVDCDGTTLADIIGQSVGEIVQVGVTNRQTSTFASETTIPEPIVRCKLDAVLPPDQEIVSPSSFCYNYSVTNKGTQPDTFRFTDAFEEIPLNFSGFFNDSGCEAADQVTFGSFAFFNLTLDRGETSNFSYELTPTFGSFPDDIKMLTIISATSDTCGDFEFRDKTCSCNKTVACPFDERCEEAQTTVLPPVPV